MFLSLTIGFLFISLITGCAFQDDNFIDSHTNGDRCHYGGYICCEINGETVSVREQECPPSNTTQLEIWSRNQAYLHVLAREEYVVSKGKNLKIIEVDYNCSDCMYITLEFDTDKGKAYAKVKLIGEADVVHADFSHDKYFPDLETCGDGVCQDAVCQSVGCPVAETPLNCPEDCG